MSYRLLPHHAPRFCVEHGEADCNVTTIGIEGYRQTRGYTCGYATSLMVVRHFRSGGGATFAGGATSATGAELTGSALYERLGTGSQGTGQGAIVRELRRAGVKVNVRYDVDLDRIALEIDRGKILVGYLFDAEHWLVIYGYGRTPDRVFVADPRPEHPCEHLWGAYGKRLGNFGIVCSAPNRARSRESVRAAGPGGAGISPRQSPLARGDQLSLDLG